MAADVTPPSPTAMLSDGRVFLLELRGSAPTEMGGRTTLVLQATKPQQPRRHAVGRLQTAGGWAILPWKRQASRAQTSSSSSNTSSSPVLPPLVSPVCAEERLSVCPELDQQQTMEVGAGGCSAHPSSPLGTNYCENNENRATTTTTSSTSSGSSGSSTSPDFTTAPLLPLGCINGNNHPTTTGDKFRKPLPPVRVSVRGPEKCSVFLGARAVR
ncbi:unnamed protein product [Lota lota]